MDSRDVSIDLGPTLQLLARYHQSGVLQATIPHLPFLREGGVGVIEVIEGKIVSCFVQSEKGDRYSVVPDMLARFDDARGPFEWGFYAQEPQKSVSPSLTTQKQPPPLNGHSLSRFDIPRAIANLNVDALAAFPLQQKRTLRMTYALIDGRRTLGDVEAHVPLPKGAVYEAITALIAMRTIVITSR